MPLIAIGLDSAEPAMIDALIAAGDLPVISALKERGSYGYLDNFDVFTAELPWTTFSTGVMPDNTGYWTPLKFDTDYSVKARAAYEYREYSPFFALGDRYRVCCFDVPQVRIDGDLNGIQINAWGAHSPQVPSESNPPEVFTEIVNKYGAHPGLHHDYAHALSMDEVKGVYDRLIDGIGLRAEVAVDLIKRENWDLFLTVFGEPHGAGHNFWQFEPEHPIAQYDIPGKDKLPERPMREVLIAIDTAIGEIVEAAPADAQIVIFSAHGMGANTLDLPSTLFLPELMYRWHYGRAALGVCGSNDDVQLKQDWGTWTRHVWNTASKGTILQRAARKLLPTRLYTPWAKRFDLNQADYPLNPITAQRLFSGIPCWMPSVWYRNCWPNMKAFALGSFSEGYIRINVKGREAKGVVETDDFQSVLDEITAMLEQVQCARTGRHMVKKIIQTRSDPMDQNPKLPDPDLVIAWQEEYASDSVVHPALGKIGPVPHFRAGSHRHTGFLLAAGDSIPSGESIQNAHALDLAPTLLALLGASVPDYMQGKVISDLIGAKGKKAGVSAGPVPQGSAESS